MPRQRLIPLTRLQPLIDEYNQRKRKYNGLINYLRTKHGLTEYTTKQVNDAMYKITYKPVKQKEQFKHRIVRPPAVYSNVKSYI